MSIDDQILDRVRQLEVFWKLNEVQIEQLTNHFKELVAQTQEQIAVGLWDTGAALIKSGKWMAGERIQQAGAMARAMVLFDKDLRATPLFKD
jgi:hypothetical protein